MKTNEIMNELMEAERYIDSLHEQIDQIRRDKNIMFANGYRAGYMHGYADKEKGEPNFYETFK